VRTTNTPSLCNLVNGIRYLTTIGCPHTKEIELAFGPNVITIFSILYADPFRLYVQIITTA
jgi:hypothetical protein